MYRRHIFGDDNVERPHEIPVSFLAFDDHEGVNAFCRRRKPIRAVFPAGLVYSEYCNGIF
jgi:hypothetical protein